VTTPAAPPPGPPAALPVDYAVREPVIAAIAVHAATGVPGVLRMEPSLSGLVTSVTRSIRQRLAGVDAAPTEGARVEIAAGRVWLDLSVAISGQGRVTEVGQAVQQAVARAVYDATGYPVAEVAVSVLHIETQPGRRRS
jgi:uncharacterized alkaline shock family protein YloU